MNQRSEDHDAEMLEEYDFSEGVRGKYIGRFADGVAVVVIEPSGAEDFSDSE
jgi:hypothetical protein